MKTSVNIPDWLVAAVRDQNEGRELGEMVREALVETLPAWAKRASETRESKMMKATLRIMRAEAVYRPAVKPKLARRKSSVKRPASERARASDARQARRSTAAAASATKGTRP